MPDDCVRSRLCPGLTGALAENAGYSSKSPGQQLVEAAQQLPFALQQANDIATQHNEDASSSFFSHAVSVFSNYVPRPWPYLMLSSAASRATQANYAMLYAAWILHPSKASASHLPAALGSPSCPACSPPSLRHLSATEDCAHSTHAACARRDIDSAIPNLIEARANSLPYFRRVPRMRVHSATV